MDKNILKVKELLHLKLFTRINSEGVSYKAGKNKILYLSDSENGGELQLLNAISKLGSDYVGNSFCMGFMGGTYRSTFHIDHLRMSDGSMKCWIYCDSSDNDDNEKVTTDLLLLKEFIKNQYKKVSHE